MFYTPLQWHLLVFFALIKENHRHFNIDEEKKLLTTLKLRPRKIKITYNTFTCKLCSPIRTLVFLVISSCDCVHFLQLPISDEHKTWQFFACKIIFWSNLNIWNFIYKCCWCKNQNIHSESYFFFTRTNQQKKTTHNCKKVLKIQIDYIEWSGPERFCCSMYAKDAAQFMQTIGLHILAST